MVQSCNTSFREWVLGLPNLRCHTLKSLYLRKTELTLQLGLFRHTEEDGR